MEEKTKSLNQTKIELKKTLKLDQNQIKLAIKALIKHHLGKQNMANLLDSSNEDFIYIDLVFKRIPEKFSIRPIAM